MRPPRSFGYRFAHAAGWLALLTYMVLCSPDAGPPIGIRAGFGRALARPAPAHGPRYIVVVRGIEEVAGVKSQITDEAREMFIAELKKHPEFTLDWPSDLPPPSDPDALIAALRQRKLRAFEVTLRILEVSRTLDPPPAGKQYQVLGRGIRLSVFGDTIPEKVMAIGGDGESRIASEVSRRAGETETDKEGKALLLDAAKMAITQAVDMTVSKLALAAKPEQKRKLK
jgi:hypothetical protein